MASDSPHTYSLGSDPACDQCRAKKIGCGRERPQCYNCQRLNMQCQFSGKGRKNNQATILSNNLSNVEERLNRIEGALSGLADSLIRIEISRSTPGSADRTPDARSTHECQDYFSDSPDLEKIKIFHGQLLRDANGHERYFRSISLASLMWEAHCIIDTRDRSAKASLASQSLSDSSKLLLECCNEISARDQLDLSHDGLPLVLPPKFILDATVGPFFSEIHGLMPIFNRQNFDTNLETIYAGGSTGCDSAWTMCFNNIVLLTLMPRTIKSQQQNSHMDAGLVKSFLDNFRRGYQHLEEFTRPTLRNVQVLITMVLVAQENFQGSVSAFLLAQACCLARSIGLHQQGLGSPGLEDSVLEERRNVFWSLYILDTTTSFIREKPKYLPLADCDVNLPPSAYPAGSPGATFAAKARLAQVQEEIYQRLYSAEAALSNPSKRRERFTKLFGDIERLETKSLGESTGRPGRGEFTHFQKELQFAFCTSRSLLYRSQRASLQCQNGLDEARRCLDIFMSLRDEKNNIGAVSALLRMFENYPFVAFFHLFCYVLNEESVSEETKTLNEVIAGLRDLQSHKSHSARSCSPLPVACALMATIEKAKTQGEDEDQDLFKDFNDTEGINSTFSQTIEAFSTLTDDPFENVFSDNSANMTPQDLASTRPLDSWYPMGYAMDTSNFM